MDKKVIEKALEAGPLPVYDGEGPFDIPAIFSLLVNPVYAGVGPYRRIIDDDKWIKAVEIQIESMGAPLVLRVLLDSLRQSLEPWEEPK